MLHRPSGSPGGRWVCGLRQYRPGWQCGPELPGAEQRTRMPQAVSAPDSLHLGRAPFLQEAREGEHSLLDGALPDPGLASRESPPWFLLTLASLNDF